MTTYFNNYNKLLTPQLELFPLLNPKHLVHKELTIQLQDPIHIQLQSKHQAKAIKYMDHLV